VTAKLSEMVRVRTAPLRILLAKAPGEAELREIARVRSYRRGWVHHVLRERAEAQARC
jgi:DNA repair protein RadD